MEIKELLDAINGLYEDGTPKTNLCLSTFFYEGDDNMSNIKSYPIRDAEVSLSLMPEEHLLLKIMFKSAKDISLGKANEVGEMYIQKVNDFYDGTAEKRMGLWLLIDPIDFQGNVNIILKDPVGIFLTSKKPSAPAKTLNMVFDIKDFADNFVVFEKSSETSEKVIHNNERRL